MKDKITLEQLAQILGKNREFRVGKADIQTCCPAHADSTPSLLLTYKNERVLFFCRAGCLQTEILSALRDTYGITPDQLNHKNISPLNIKNIEFNKTEKEEINSEKNPYKNFIGLKRQKDLIIKNISEIYLPEKIAEKYKKHPTKEDRAPKGWWWWHNEYGKKIFLTIRYEVGEKKEIVPYTFWATNEENPKFKWFFKAPPSPNILYDIHLSSIRKDILIVEGEKTVEAAKLLFSENSNIFDGMPWITTTIGGSNRALSSNLNPIKGRKLFIAQDMDAAGLKYAMKFKNTEATEIYLIRIPYKLKNEKTGEINKIKKGYDIDDLIKEGFNEERFEKLCTKKNLIYKIK